ncbi:MAG: hypothetical protein H7843_02220 [Nitrospirota bacterium]
MDYKNAMLYLDNNNRALDYLIATIATSRTPRIIFLLIRLILNMRSFLRILNKMFSKLHCITCNEYPACTEMSVILTDTLKKLKLIRDKYISTISVAKKISYIPKMLIREQNNIIIDVDNHIENLIIATNNNISKSVNEILLKPNREHTKNWKELIDSL